MEQVEARLSDLGSAAQALRDSAQRLEQCQSAVRDIVHELLAQGISTPLSAVLLTLQTPSAELWRMAQTLEQAEQDLGQALSSGAFLSRLQAIRARIEGESRAKIAPPVPAVLAPVAFDGYIARANRPVYQRWRELEQALSADAQHLEQLQARHQATLDEATMLSQRLLSYDPYRDVSQDPALNALYARADLQAQELQMARQQHALLKADAQALELRLERIKPADGADLHLIAGLERGQTAPSVLANTQGCVNYIAQKLTIPVELARDAHLWDEQIAQHPQWGIRIGTTPLVGSVILMEREHPYADDVYGHVMYVERVDGADIWVTDNYHAEAVRLQDLTQELDSLKYLYFAWHTRA